MHDAYKDIGSPLIRVIEECSEVIKVACKVQRFGWTNYNPNDPEKRMNIDLMRDEISDVIAAFQNIEKEMDKIYPPKGGGFNLGGD